MAVGGDGGNAFEDLKHITSATGSSIVKVSRIELFLRYSDKIVAFVPTYLLES